MYITCIVYVYVLSSNVFALLGSRTGHLWIPVQHDRDLSRRSRQYIRQWTSVFILLCKRCVIILYFKSYTGMDCIDLRY